MTPVATLASGDDVPGTHNARTFTDRFFEMEAAEGMFRLTDRDGLFYWDILRHDVYYSLWSYCGGGPRSAPVAPPSRLTYQVRNLYRHLHVLWTQWQLRTKAPRYVFVTASRNQIQGDWLDVVAEPCLQRYRECSFVLESFSKRSKYLWRSDGAFASIPQWSWPVDDATIAAQISKNTRRYFAAEIAVDELTAIVIEGIRAYRNQLRYFERLLKQCRPAALLIVSNGIVKGFFHAAKKSGVPAFELQHGLISRLHPYYSYPPGVDYSHLRFLPDFLLTFSEFWGRQIHFAGVPTVAIGTEHYRSRPLAGPAGDSKRGLLIITAERYHEALSQIAMELARHVPQLSIVYKLHPQQYEEMEQIAAQLSSCPNIQLRAGERSVAELFVQADVLFTVQSTVVYEALQAQLHVILLQRDDYHVHEDVFSLVHLCTDARSVLKALEAIGGGAAVRPSAVNFFDSFEGQVLDRLVGRPEAT